MSEQMHVPEQYAHLVELANEGVGGFVLYSTDDFFAGHENLLQRPEAVFIADKYTDKGKWMDGWESQRRRTPGHDFAIIRLGLPGEVHGVVVDTTHFKGNAPTEAALEGLDAPSATLQQLLDSDAWHPMLEKSKTRPDSKNVFDIGDRRRVTHLKLRIYPDGGVARLRVFGQVVPEARIFRRPGAVDLVSVENGGTVVKVSDRFFGPPANLLLPGRGVNMGDGWETARRRTPGSDWAVLQLGRPGVVERIELDTHFFKGNAPQAVLMEALDARGLDTGAIDAFCATGAGGTELLGRSPTEQHKRHVFQPDRRFVATHVRVHIFPHGGVNRLRLYGEPVDSTSDAAKLAFLNGLTAEAAVELFISFNGSKHWAKAMAAERPFASLRALFEAAERHWGACDEGDRLEAFAAHPRIGESKASATQTTQSAAWSKGEQSRASDASTTVREQLSAKNAAYAEKFGFIYICFATGRTADEMLAWLEERLMRTRTQELETAAAEQAKITRLRLDKWLDA